MISNQQKSPTKLQKSHGLSYTTLSRELYFRNPIFLSPLLYWVKAWKCNIYFYLIESTVWQPILLTHIGMTERLLWLRSRPSHRQSKEFFQPILAMFQVLGLALCWYLHVCVWLLEAKWEGTSWNCSYIKRCKNSQGTDYVHYCQRDTNPWKIFSACCMARSLHLLVGLIPCWFTPVVPGNFD